MKLYDKKKNRWEKHKFYIIAENVFSEFTLSTYLTQQRYA